MTTCLAKWVAASWFAHLPTPTQHLVCNMVQAESGGEQAVFQRLHIHDVQQELSGSE